MIIGYSTSLFLFNLFVFTLALYHVAILNVKGESYPTQNGTQMKDGSTQKGAIMAP